jgi:chromosome segregation ATPase
MASTQQQLREQQDTNELSDIAIRIDTIQLQIDFLCKQIDPIQQQIRALRTEQTTLRKQIQPCMVATETKRIVCDNVKIKRGTTAQKLPFRPATIADALRAYFHEHGLEIDVEAIVAFIEQYRKTNKVACEKIQVCRNQTRAKGNRGAEIMITGTPTSVSSSPPEEPMVKPFAF